MTEPEDDQLDMRQFRDGWLSELRIIRTWLSTLGHGGSRAAAATQQVLDVADELTGLVNDVAGVWDVVQAYQRGEVSRKAVDRAVAKYEQKTTET